MQIITKYPTLDQYREAFTRQPAEVIAGEIVPVSPNTRQQPDVAANLFLSLGVYVRDHKLGKVIIEATFVLDGNRREQWIKGARMPDVAFIARDRFQAHNREYPPDEPWWLAPDLAVEIVSPTDSPEDVSQKVADYLQNGVRLVWVIEPRKRTVRVHTPDQPTGQPLKAGDELTAAPLIEGWSMRVDDLFNEE
jgi:Uma2 family endonuclease